MHLPEGQECPVLPSGLEGRWDQLDPERGKGQGQCCVEETLQEEAQMTSVLSLEPRAQSLTPTAKEAPETTLYLHCRSSSSSPEHECVLKTQMCT